MRRILIFIILLTAPLCQSAVAQYRLDIKTKLAEKADLKIIKDGVITAVNQSSWATEVEFNENYSLWIRNMRRRQRGDSMRIGLTVQLRTPAALTEGELVSERRIGIRYHWQKAQEFARDSISADMLSSDDQRAMMKLIGMTGKAVDVAEDMTSGGVASVEEKAYTEMLRGLVTAMEYRPSPVQVMEALVLGRRTVRTAEQMLKNHGR